MAQPTKWVPAILDSMKKVKSSISTVVLAPKSSSDSSFVDNHILYDVLHLSMMSESLIYTL